MRRELPTEPHLDHLKKQAKDLLDAHRRGERDAVERIRAVMPSFAGLSDDEIRGAPFALHDAQSAIAREYGFRSWNDLRAEVVKRRDARAGATADALTQALIGAPFTALTGMKLPDAIAQAMKDGWSAASRAPETTDESSHPLPTTLPLLAVRNALVLPAATVPLHVARPASLAAIEVATKSAPPWLATFAQRDPAVEDLRMDALHPVGCLVTVLRHVPDEQGRAFVVLRGVRWIALRGLDATGSFAVASVAPADIDESDDAGEVPALFEMLRDRARRLAKKYPEPERLLAVVDGIDEAGRLADLVVANLPCSVDDKARYAAEPMLPAKVRIAVALSDAVLAATG